MCSWYHIIYTMECGCVWSKLVGLNEEGGDTAELSGSQLAGGAQSVAAHEEVDDDVEVGQELGQHPSAGGQEGED